MTSAEADHAKYGQTSLSSTQEYTGPASPAIGNVEELGKQLKNKKASENLLKSLIKRREEVPTDFHETGAMIERNWTTANFEMRHSLTRLTVHGFLHVICNNPSFHEPSDSCKCTLCDQLCERYHLERCRKRTRSIKDYAF